jgi:hypothetical protein
MDPNYVVVEGHTFKEFIYSDTALRKGIANIPNALQEARIITAAKAILPPLEQKFGRMRITSWFRSPELCVALGSKPTSNHTIGDTADLEPVNPKVPLVDVFQFIAETMPFDELIAEYFPDGWVHVCDRAGQAAKVIKLKDKTNDYKQLPAAQIVAMYQKK